MLATVDHTGIQADRQLSTISFAQRGMGVDVGGIAKGWVGDRFRAQLRQQGVQTALIDIGGNILTVGETKNGQRWNIGIQDPNGEQGEILGVLSVAETSVVTSGDYERAVTIDGVRYHHIIDPKTGFPTDNELSSVTIVTENSTYADALSTAIYVKGLERGWEFVNSLPDVEALFVTKDNGVIPTANLGPQFTLQSEQFTVRQRQ